MLGRKRLPKGLAGRRFVPDQVCEVWYGAVENPGREKTKGGGRVGWDGENMRLGRDALNLLTVSLLRLDYYIFCKWVGVLSLRKMLFFVYSLRERLSGTGRSKCGGGDRCRQLAPPEENKGTD